MGFRRKSFDKENVHTDTEQVYKKKRRKKKRVDVQINDLVKLQEEMHT
jgi:hypothetical protein